MLERFNKTRSVEALKRYAQEQRRLPEGQQLSPWPLAQDLVYEINPVFLEIGQGGASPMRGWGTILFVLGAYAIWLGFKTVPFFFTGEADGNELVTMGLGVFGIVVLVFSSLPVLLWLYLSFFAVTDVVVRFDRKRGKVWMWTGGGPIEMRWADLTPVVQGMAASAQLPGRTYRGLYAEFDDTGEYKTTRKIAHAIQVGQISAAEEGVMPALEYVRLYMAQGPQAVPEPERLLTHRPRWYAMVNFLGMADEWALIAAGKPAPLGKPWFRTGVFVVFFPLLFPLQVTNWLALRVAPVPKWPREITQMHEIDLSEFKRSSDDDPAAARPRRKPVIRVNGQLVDPSVDAAQRE